MKKIILFDIDYTLINTDLIRSATTSQLANALKISEKSIATYLNNYSSSLNSSTDFDPDKFINLLTKDHTFNKSFIRNIFYQNPDIYKSSLYPDTISTLNNLFGEYVLGTYSEGVNDFQMTKITQSGVSKYLNKKHINILKRKLQTKELIKIPQNSIIVDDKLEVVEKLSKMSNVFPVWVNRKTAEIHKEIKTVFKLEQIPNIIN